MCPCNGPRYCNKEVLPEMNRFICCIFLSWIYCEAKIINANTNSSFITRVSAGAAQSFQWMGEWAVGKSDGRPPKKVQLALVGLGRTGSTSFVQALKELGYTPAHDDEVSEVSDLYSNWWARNLSDDEFIDAMGQRGFDAPFIPVHRYVEWAATRPDIKVIITTRDKHKWAQSYLSVIESAFLITYRPFKWLKMMQEIKDINMEMMINVPTEGK